MAVNSSTQNANRNLRRAVLLAALLAVGLGVALLLSTVSALAKEPPAGSAGPAPSKPSHEESLNPGSTPPGTDDQLSAASSPCTLEWRVVPSSDVSSSDNTLNSVAVAGPNDVWAVGHYYLSDDTTRTLIEHWDGTSWSVVSGADLGSTNSLLYSVAVAGPNDVWAVGVIGVESTMCCYYETLIEHWDGTSWSVVDGADLGLGRHELNSVAVVGPNDVWAVGSTSYDGEPFYTLVEHWDGTSWSVVPSANAGSSADSLNSVAAVGPNDVWAVGHYYLSDNTTRTLIEHWDGTSWSVVDGPDFDGPSTLNSVAVAGPNDVWAVGGDLVEHYNDDFSDVQAGSPFYPFVTCLIDRGIVSGYPDCTFRPNNVVTRGQLSKIVSNSAGFSEEHATQTFEDVPTDSPFYIWIERLASRGIISGYPCGGPGEPCKAGERPYFRPGGDVSRGQTSKIVAVAAGLPAPPQGQQTFQDVAANSTFWEWIEALATTGAISGYTCGGPGEPCEPPQDRKYFRPGSSVTRGQSSKIVASTFFPDCQTSAKP